MGSPIYRHPIQERELLSGMSKISCPTPKHRCCRSTCPRPPLPLRQHHICSGSPNPKGIRKSLSWGTAGPRHARPRCRAGAAWG